MDKYENKLRYKYTITIYNDHKNRKKIIKCVFEK